MDGFTTTLTDLFDAVVVKGKVTLKAEGVGMLSDIGVQHAMNAKLGHPMPHCRTLRACKPALAYQALAAGPTIRLLLPCSVIDVHPRSPDSPRNSR